jgi:hypothetical protein
MTAVNEIIEAKLNAKDAWGTPEVQEVRDWDNDGDEEIEFVDRTRDYRRVMLVPRGVILRDEYRRYLTLVYAWQERGGAWYERLKPFPQWLRDRGLITPNPMATFIYSAPKEGIDDNDDD